MSLSNTNELDEKLIELRVALAKKDSYAYVAGYMESLFARIIKAYVPAQRHQDVIELINRHVATLQNSESDVKS